MNADDVLKILCEADVVISDYTKIRSVPYIANELCITKYRARKLINELRNRGLVVAEMESCFNDDLSEYRIANGFVITPKARETEIYKNAKAAEERTRKKIFGF